ncbi:hypothetical protein E2562_005471 [Oryza meyeriana var. granulata]|uniref:Uncharacterized protein n=1 Tax=Oryza meyeriana var. granulata TaxID=110450 RepID=A0A6G1DFB4_9ORYZ|nr:hypothetical protein E2562_005471 [Oryza meyeriana var. granulata]
MLQASLEPQRPAAAGMWVPGMSPQAVDAGSARAQEIARRREEMLGMLHDLPESEYELSLTDLVEKTGGGGAGVAPPSPSPSEGGKEQPGPAGTGRTASGRRSEQQQQAAMAGRPERRGSARRWDGSGSSFRSSSDGVLLNFYMPRSLTRSFTAPRAGPGRPPSVSGGRSGSVCSDRSKRERDGETVRCWSLLWDRRWRKSSRGDHANESTIRAAILKAAKHNASSPKKI